MTKDELYTLLNELSLPDTVISILETPQWHFWRKSEQIRENEMFSLLQEFIEQKTNKSDAKIRENAYALSAKLLLKNFDMEHCQFLIDRLKIETSKYVLHTILDGIGRLRLPADMDVEAVVMCSRSGEWLVRHSAIMALGKCNTDTSREAVRYWVRQENEKQYKYELIYANAALGYIGEPCDVDLLERHTNSRVPDVKDSAMYAITNIRQRFGENPASK